MSEPQNLVPNLNEIMDEYDELENETVQATQVVTGQGEERAEVNDELERTVEESRKRKRGKEEMKKQRTSNKKLVTGSLTWQILLGEASYSIETSSGREASTNRFLHSKS